jgi:hypothetical protein
MGRSLYGVFFVDQITGRAMWCLGRNKRAARRRARTELGYVIEVTNAFGYGAPSAWDAPTFKVCGNRIADYRAPLSP